MFQIMKLSYIRAQLASSLLVVVGRDHQFGKMVYAKLIML